MSSKTGSNEPVWVNWNRVIWWWILIVCWAMGWTLRVRRSPLISTVKTYHCQMWQLVWGKKRGKAASKEEEEEVLSKKCSSMTTTYRLIQRTNMVSTRFHSRATLRANASYPGTQNCKWGNKWKKHKAPPSESSKGSRTNSVSMRVVITIRKDLTVRCKLIQLSNS